MTSIPNDDLASATLLDLIAPCGPIMDRPAAARAMERLGAAAEQGGWGEALGRAWPALTPVFAASPYLAGLATREPGRLWRVLGAPPTERLAALVAAADASAKPVDEGPSRRGDAAAAMRELRALKAELHLLTALADLGGVWDLEMVTGALSDFADAAARRAVSAAAREAVERGWLIAPEDGRHGPLPGFFVIAMGKLGARELNYSSDIDLSVFYEPDALLLQAGAEPAGLARRLTDRIADYGKW
jgi:glutamate-ammonia-ligase adenylyltransferase